MIYMMVITKYLLGITLLPLIASEAAFIDSDDDPSLEPTLDDRTFESIACQTKDGKDGICVQESYCNAEHTIMPGGVIDESEFREMTQKPCPGLFQWCCTQDLIVAPPVINNTRSDNCLPLDSDVCPWCVKLYKVSDLKIVDTSVFCAGALIGSRIVLTSATCLKAAQHHMLYVRVPFSANAKHKYIAQHRKLHPQYNSGTHWYDFGIIILEEEVNWGGPPGRGACLGFSKLAGNCMTVGYDTSDDFASTILQVSDGTCKGMGGGGSFEAFCGESTEKLCFAAPGAPVICESSTGGLIIYGVVRSGCIKNKILLGSVTSSSSWLLRELDAMKVAKNIYIQKP